MERCQRHVHNFTCYKHWKGPPEPKVCRFELDSTNINSHTTFDPCTGEMNYQHIDGLINNFNLTVIEAVRCNIDLKFIGSGGSAKAILFYITDYIAKNQLKGYIAYALLEHGVQKIEMLDSCSNDIKIQGKQLLQKCAHALISQQELSSQQVMSYLLDYEDHFTSHSFKPLYWTAFENYVNKQIPSPECYTTSNLQQQPIQSDSNLQSVQNATPNQNETSNDHDSDDEIKISVVDDKLVIDASQQAEYVFRNSLLDEM